MKRRKESISMWLRESIAALTEGPPKGSVFACSHLRWVEPFSLPKVLYFHRTPELDELWDATVVTEYRDRREQNNHLAMEAFRKREIIVAARALGPDPNPGCEESAMWTAGCPGRGHHLAIHAVHNEFYCGYCVRKGGIPELEYFCAERREPCGDQGGNETSAVTGK